jgi:hypothetical protein
VLPEGRALDPAELTNPQPPAKEPTMPRHRIPRAHLDEDLRELARHEGERVVSTTYEGDFAIVETEYITIETRVVS